MGLHPLVSHVLYDEATLASRVKELGVAISAAYAPPSPPPLLLYVTCGAFVFAADLVRCLAVPGLEVDCVRASSYGDGTETSGSVEVTLSADVAGRHVLLVEDIVDSGLTLTRLSALLLARGAAGVRVATLLDKAARRKVELVPDFVGFTCPDEFVVGYGLDFGGKYRGARELPYIGVLKPEAYAAAPTE